MKNTLQTTDITDSQLTKYQWKGNKKQRLALDYWIDPTSETFGNAYKSWLKAGFSPSYSKNIMNIAPKWLSEYIDRLDLQPEHIKQGLQQLALNSPNSRSPDDTRLKAYETLAKIAGMIDNKGVITNIMVQPILGGQSVEPPTKTVESSVIETTDQLDTSNNDTDVQGIQGDYTVDSLIDDTPVGN